MVRGSAGGGSLMPPHSLTMGLIERSLSLRLGDAGGQGNKASHCGLVQLGDKAVKLDMLSDQPLTLNRFI